MDRGGWAKERKQGELELERDEDCWTGLTLNGLLNSILVDLALESPHPEYSIESESILFRREDEEIS